MSGTSHTSNRRVGLPKVHSLPVMGYHGLQDSINALKKLKVYHKTNLDCLQRSPGFPDI